MTQAELKDMLKSNNRYSKFIIFDKPVRFKEEFADKPADVVQLHSIQTYNTENGKDIVGFCGQCSWKNNTLVPLDGDSYSENMTVYGYSWWSNAETNICSGLDILVGTDW